MRLFRRKPQEHNVAVHDVRPPPDEQEDFEPYFIAICDCGWIGDGRFSAEESFRDAQGHSPTVAEELRRPVG